MQRTLGTILVAVIVVFAGCGGVLGGGSDESVKTLTPVPEPTPKPAPTPVQLAPGLTENGVENMSTLVAVSKSFFQNQPFAATTNLTAVAPNGSVLARATATLRAGPAGTITVSDYHKGSILMNASRDPVHTERWLTDERIFIKSTYTNGTTTYSRRSTDGEAAGFSLAFTPLTHIGASFGIKNTTVTERVTRNGTTLYRVHWTSPDTYHPNTTIQLLVDSHGIIHKYTIIRRFSNTEKAGIAKTVVTWELSGIKMVDAPKPPSWVDEALNQTTPIQQTGTITEE